MNEAPNRTPLILSFPYKFDSHTAPLNLDQLFARFVGYLLDYMEEYCYDHVEYFLITFSVLSSSLNHEKPVKNVNSIP